MVKNTTGGSSHKRFARKNQGGGRGTATWDKSDPLLLEVSVIKPLGDCRFQVHTKDRRTLICHVSSRFSGRFKHHNLVITNSMLLVSLREYENPPKHCDFLQKLSDTTPPDFFTVRLEGYSTNEDLELDIFQRGGAAAAAVLEPVPEALQGENGVWGEGEMVGGGEIDFDAI